MIHVRAVAVKNIRSAACIDLSGVRLCSAIEDMYAFLEDIQNVFFIAPKRHLTELGGKSLKVSEFV